MLYLIQQIILCLMLTAIIGIAVGWLLRGLGTSRQTDLVEAKWRARVEQLQGGGADSPTPGPAADADIAELQRLLADREKELATLRTAQAVRKQSGSPDSGGDQQLHEKQIIVQQLQGQLAEQRTEHQQLQKRYAHTVGERQALVERLRDLETRNAELTKDRQHALDTVAELQKELRNLHATGPAPQAHQPATPPPAQSTPPASPAADSAAPPPAAERSARRAAAAVAAAGKLAGQQSLPIQDTPPARKKPYEPGWRLPAPDGEADPLQAIYGIGPKIESQLKQLGVFHFRQIAAFTTNDIAWVEMHLKSFPGRVLRDRWVEQARALEKRRQSGQPI